MRSGVTAEPIKDEKVLALQQWEKNILILGSRNCSYKDLKERKSLEH